MKNVLVVAYYFPPHATVGSLRPLGFCRHLEKYGWRPSVVTTDNASVHPPCPLDADMSQSLSPNIEVLRIGYTNGLQTLLAIRKQVQALLRFGRPQNGHPAEKAEHESRAGVPRQPSALSNMKTFCLDWAFDFPDQSNRWLPAVMRHVSSLSEEHTPDLVYATGGPWTGLLVGLALAKRFGVPFVADFRDPWVGDSAQRFISSYLKRKAEKLEARICQGAAAIVANTEELRAEFVKRYPALAAKFVTITNGFNFAPVRSESTLGKKKSHGEGIVELCHFGNIYGGRSAASLFQAVSELYEERAIEASRFRIRFVGVWADEDRNTSELSARLAKAGLLKIDPPVSHQQCLQEMADAQLLLILQPHSTVRIPAKTYEYIASGRPILLIGEEGAASRLIQQHRLGIWCRESVPAIKSMLASLASGAAKVMPPAQQDTARFDYRVLTGQLAGLFEKVLSERRPETRAL